MFPFFDTIFGTAQYGQSRDRFETRDGGDCVSGQVQLFELRTRFELSNGFVVQVIVTDVQSFQISQGTHSRDGFE